MIVRSDETLDVPVHASGTMRLHLFRPAIDARRAHGFPGVLFFSEIYQDPHVPFVGREAIRTRLEAVGADYEWHEVDAAHAFLRDEGPRYDPELFRQAVGWMLDLYARAL